jgi:cytochrome c oxidase subunit 2
MSRIFDLEFGFQDPATPIMEGIIDLHNHIFFYLIIIFVFVARFFYFILKSGFYDLHYPNTWCKVLNHRAWMLHDTRLTHGTILEIVWTVIPSIILVFIAIPSFALLYSMDEVLNPMLTFKAIGHQWYWAYEFTDLNVKDPKYVQPAEYKFDANMLYEDQLDFGEHRLLQTDNPVILPTNVHIRVIITSTDVLHSWAVPALGVKVDAVPGRLNQTFIYLKREGTFYGQCSELCGVNHGFMPIQIKGTSLVDWQKHILENLELKPEPEPELETELKPELEEPKVVAIDPFPRWKGSQWFLEVFFWGPKLTFWTYGPELVDQLPPTYQKITPFPKLSPVIVDRLADSYFPYAKNQKT